MKNSKEVQKEKATVLDSGLLSHCQSFPVEMPGMVMFISMGDWLFSSTLCMYLMCLRFKHVAVKVFLLNIENGKWSKHQRQSKLGKMLISLLLISTNLE